MTTTTTSEAPASPPSEERIYRMAVLDFATGVHRMIPDDATPGPSGTLSDDPWTGLYHENTDGFLEPRYNPVRMLRSVEESETLAPTLEAFATMIEGTGTVPERYKPDGHTATQEMDEERIEAQRRATLGIIGRFGAEDPARMRIVSRIHLCATGYRAFEVIRHRDGRIAYLHHLSSATLRATRLDPDEQETVWPQRDPETGAWLQGNEAYTRGRRFRRWAQLEGGSGGAAGKKVWFKEFGDPRDYDRTTGKRVDPDAHVATGGRLANEVIVEVTMPDPLGGPYGVPMLAAIGIPIDGNIEAAKVNFRAFVDGFRIPLLITIVGGFFSEADMGRFKERINEKKGADNFHEPLVLPVQKDVSGGVMPGMAAGTAGNPVITVTKLRDVFPEDHTHERYQDRNDRKIGQRFRLPPVFRGATEGEYTFATIWASLWVFEKTVAKLERSRTDDLINRLWLPEEGIDLWVVRTQGIPVADLSELNALLRTLVDSGTVTPDEVRGIAARMADIQLDPLEDGEGGWSETPLGKPTALASVPATDDETAPADEAPAVPEIEPEDDDEDEEDDPPDPEDPSPDDDEDEETRRAMRHLRLVAVQRRLRPRRSALPPEYQ